MRTICHLGMAFVPKPDVSSPLQQLQAPRGVSRDRKGARGTAHLCYSPSLLKVPVSLSRDEYAHIADFDT